MQSWWANLRGKEDPNTILGHTGKKYSKDHILALEDINLDVLSGEVVGIIHSALTNYENIAISNCHNLYIRKNSLF